MWIITKDLLFENSRYDDRNEAGIGSRNCTIKDHTDIKAIKKLMPYRFRMLDDDKEPYYEGYCNTNDDENAFSPLDDFGEGNAGCTIIQYWKTGKGGGWETL